MSDEEDDELPEYSGGVSGDIQVKIEEAIRNMLNSKELATQVKAVSLAAKMGMVKVADRNIKVSETSEMITSLLVMLMMEHGLSIKDLVAKMTSACPSCRRIGGSKRKPKVIR